MGMREILLRAMGMLGVVTLGLALSAASPARPAGPKAVALVIAESAYDDLPYLANTIADGKLVGEALAKAGFDVGKVRIDATRAEILAALDEFALKARSADKAVVYFAGHGMEYRDRNWLVPVDAKLAREADIASVGVPMQAFIDAVRPAGKLRAVILDACRNNRASADWKAAEQAAGQRTLVLRSMRDGLQSDAAMVAFSAKAGTPAYDSAPAGSRNSPFAKALAERIALPGIDARRLIDIVADDVRIATEGLGPVAQQPVAFGVPGPTPYFRDRDTESAQAETDDLFFQTANAANSVGDYERYLSTFPRGAHAREAQLALSQLYIDMARAAPPADLKPVVIDPSGKGDAKTIPEAIRNASGKKLRLVLRPGAHAGPIFLGFSIEEIWIEGPRAGGTATIAADISPNGGTRVWIRDVTINGGVRATAQAHVYAARVKVSHDLWALSAGDTGRLVFVDGQAASTSDALHTAESAFAVVACSSLAASSSRSVGVINGSRASVLDSALKGEDEIAYLPNSGAGLIRGNQIELTQYDKGYERGGGMIDKTAHLLLEENAIYLPQEVKADVYFSNFDYPGWVKQNRLTAGRAPRGFIGKGCPQPA